MVPRMREDDPLWVRAGLHRTVARHERATEALEL